MLKSSGWGTHDGLSGLYKTDPGKLLGSFHRVKTQEEAGSLV